MPFILPFILMGFRFPPRATKSGFSRFGPALQGLPQRGIRRRIRLTLPSGLFACSRLSATRCWTRF